MTEYVILKKAPVVTHKETAKESIIELGDGAWHRLPGFHTAASAPAAIKLALNGADEGGEFIAVPARSWQPVKVSIEKAVRLG